MASQPRSALEFAAVLRSSRLVDDETLRAAMAQLERRAQRAAEWAVPPAPALPPVDETKSAYDAPPNAPSTQVGPATSSAKTVVDPDESAETAYPRSLPEQFPLIGGLPAALATDDSPEDRRVGGSDSGSGSDKTGSSKNRDKAGSSKGRPPLEPGDRTAGELAELLVRKELITPWQREQLEAGRPERIWLGKCKLTSLLARGGMSSLFLATHTGVDRLVVVKVLPASKAKEGSFRERFIAEAEASARLNHPNVIRVLSFDRDPDRNLYYMVFEYVAGLDLQRWIAQRGPLDCEQAADFLAQAADGLAHAHERGVIHRDVKPGNLLVDAEGRVKILDFGLARQRSRKNSITLEHHDKILGTVDYLAPEQAMDSHHVEPRVDQYSLGCTLFYALTGRPPFQAASMTERLLQHAYDAPPLLSEARPDVPEALSQVCLKLLAKRPEDRYADASEAAWALRSCFPRLAARYAPTSGCVVAAEAAAPRAAGGSSAGSTILSSWGEQGQSGPPPLPTGVTGVARDEGSGIGATDDPLRPRPSNTNVCGSSGTVMLAGEGEEWSPADVVEDHDHGVPSVEIDLQHLPAVGLGDASSSGGGFTTMPKPAAEASSGAASRGSGSARSAQAGGSSNPGSMDFDALDSDLKHLSERGVSGQTAFEPSSMSLMEGPNVGPEQPLPIARAPGAGIVGDGLQSSASRDPHAHRRRHRTGRPGEPRRAHPASDAALPPTPSREGGKRPGRSGGSSIDDLPLGALCSQFDTSSPPKVEPPADAAPFDPNKTYIPDDDDSSTELAQDGSGETSSVFLPPGAIALPAGPAAHAPQLPSTTKQPVSGKPPASARSAPTPVPAAKPAPAGRATNGSGSTPVRPGQPAGTISHDKTRISQPAARPVAGIESDKTPLSPVQPGAPIGPMATQETRISALDPPPGMEPEKPSSEARKNEARKADFDSFQTQPTDLARPAARRTAPAKGSGPAQPHKPASRPTPAPSAAGRPSVAPPAARAVVNPGSSPAAAGSSPLSASAVGAETSVGSGAPARAAATPIVAHAAAPAKVRHRNEGEGSGEAGRRSAGRSTPPPVAAGPVRTAAHARTPSPARAATPNTPSTDMVRAFVEAAAGTASEPTPRPTPDATTPPETRLKAPGPKTPRPAADKPLIDLAGAVGLHAPPASDVDSSLISSINFDVLRQDSAASDTGGATSTDVMTRPPAAEKSRSRSAAKPVSDGADAAEWASVIRWIAVVVACSGISGLLGYALGSTRPALPAKATVSTSFLEDEARRARAKFADPSVKWVPNTPKK